jgi:hypothetical protein
MWSTTVQRNSANVQVLDRLWDVIQEKGREDVWGPGLVDRDIDDSDVEGMEVNETREDIEFHKVLVLRSLWLGFPMIGLNKYLSNCLEIIWK